MNVEGVEAWNKQFFDQISLGDLAEDNWRKIGSVVQYPGAPVGKFIKSYFILSSLFITIIIIIKPIA